MHATSFNYLSTVGYAIRPSLRLLHRFIIDSMGVVKMQDAMNTKAFWATGSVVGFLKLCIGVFFIMIVNSLATGGNPAGA